MRGLGNRTVAIEIDMYFFSLEARRAESRRGHCWLPPEAPAGSFLPPGLGAASAPGLWPASASSSHGSSCAHVSDLPLLPRTVPESRVDQTKTSTAGMSKP